MFARTSLALLLALLSLGCISSAFGQIVAKKQEQTSYLVIEIDEGRLYVLAADKLDPLRRQLEDGYRMALERWRELRRNDPELKQPERRKISIVAGNLRDEASAQEQLQRIEERRRSSSQAAGKKTRDRER